MWTKILDAAERVAEKIGASVHMGVCLMQEVTPRTRAMLVSFGERMSTRILRVILRSRGVNAKQYDAFEIGMVTSDDDIENGRVLPESYANLKQSLTLTGWGETTNFRGDWIFRERRKQWGDFDVRERRVGFDGDCDWCRVGTGGGAGVERRRRRFKRGSERD